MATLLLLGATFAGSTAPAVALKLAAYVNPSGDELGLEVIPHAAADEVFVGSGDRQNVQALLSATLAPASITFAPLEWSWNREIGAGGSGSLSYPASSGNFVPDPPGYERSWAGPPPGQAGISVGLLYGVDRDLEVGLATEAVSARSRRSITPTGHVMSLDLLDPAGRYDGYPVEFSLPSNHGLTPGAIIRALALEAGVPSSSISVPSFGPSLSRAVEIAGTGWLGRAREIAESFGYALDFDAAGLLAAYRWPPVELPQATLEMRHLAADPGLEIEADGGAPTCVRVLGSAPELPGGAGGLISYPPEVREVTRRFSVPRAVWSQNADGSLSATGFGTAAEYDQVVERTEIYRTKVGDCLIREETLVYAWYAPKVARYNRKADGTLAPIQDTVPPGGIASFPGYIYEAGASAGDNADAFLWGEHRFILVSRELSIWEYTGAGGALQVKQTSHGGWFNPTAAIKHRSDVDAAWESQPFEQRYVEGNGRTVGEPEETFYSGFGADVVNFSRATTVGQDGFKLSDQTLSYGFGAGPGFFWLYASNEVLDAPELGSGFRTGWILKQYIPAGPSAHVEITSSYDSRGYLIERVREDVEGYLPAVEKCDPDVSARRSARPIEAIVCAVGVSGASRTVDVNNDWIETDDQAVALAGWELQRRRAQPITVRVAAWGAARPGLPITVHMPRLGLVNAYGWIHRCEHSQSGVRQPITTTLELRISG